MDERFRKEGGIDMDAINQYRQLIIDMRNLEARFARMREEDGEYVLSEKDSKEINDLARAIAAFRATLKPEELKIVDAEQNTPNI